MIIKAMTETIGSEEVHIGINFTAENNSELAAFREWMRHKNIGSIGDDGKDISISFDDVSKFLGDKGCA